MNDEPQILETEERNTAVIRLKVPRERMQEVMGPAIGELMAGVAAQGVAPAGPLFSHHFRMQPDVFDFEVGVPVATPVAAAGRIEPGSLPAARVARTVYRGPYEGLGEAWGELDAWVVSEDLTPADNLWECYLRGPESSPDPSTWETELNRPLAD